MVSKRQCRRAVMTILFIICIIFTLSSIRPTSVPRSKTQKLVLIQTYMRSGSSLTGDIVQRTPEVFYVYEPLRFLRTAVDLKKSLTYMNGSRRNSPFNFDREGIKVLNDWFTCSIDEIPINGLLDIFMQKGIQTSKFHECLHMRNRTRQVDRPALQICARELKKVCEKSQIIVLKTIRVKLRDVKVLLSSLTNLKIIRLVRDPRAALFSQLHYGMCSKMNGGLHGCTNFLCEWQEVDILEEKLISAECPDRLMVVEYENIARHPIQASVELYDFIDADFTEEIKNYIYNITMAGESNNCGICTTRSNSSEHIDSWKKEMTPKFIHLVNTRCSIVMNHYSYHVDTAKA